MNLLSLTCSELTDLFRDRYGKGAYHARAVYREAYRRGNLDVSVLPEFEHAPALARRLGRDLAFSPDPVVAEQRQGRVIKYVSQLTDGLEVESVILPMATHQTLCLSSQVGCRMNCRFCQTGRSGWQRNLKPDEIVAQVVTAMGRYGIVAPNVVFMGMGEPLDNIDAVIQAIRVMSDQRGLDIARRHITVSTVGLPEGIERLGRLNWPQLNLAISLNAPNDQIRSRIMPLAGRVSMTALRRALEAYPLRPGGCFFMEYVLIKEVNDAAAHARELARYLRPLPVKLNVIACNPAPGSGYAPPPEADIQAFCDILVAQKVFVRRRRAKGREIMAACGQLGNRLKRGQP